MTILTLLPRTPGPWRPKERQRSGDQRPRLAAAISIRADTAAATTIVKGAGPVSLGSPSEAGGRGGVKNRMVGEAVGLALLGASTGAFVALITVLLSKAWLEVTSGKLKGTEFVLDKFLRQGGPAAIVGSSPLKADIALPDPDIAPQHALLIGGGSQLNLKDISLRGTYVNNRRVEIATLIDRQRIRMGNTELVYHERR